MCGIAGYAVVDRSRIEPAVLDRMIDVMAYRGPDDRGLWTGSDVGLAHARLSILDLGPGGHQPFVTRDGSGVLAYNGEVYNFRELRGRLGAEGVRFDSATDTEVVLYALHRWGVERAVPELDGMFAFAYWDGRSETLWLGRDRSGIKPLYVAERDGVLVFASEMKALFSHPAIPCRADGHALTTHVLRHRLTGTWTPFEGVEALLPGTVVPVQRGRRGRERTYFDLGDAVDPQRIRRGRDEPLDTARDRLETVFEASVRAHLVSDAPLATMCSGGLDSSLMTVFASRAKPDLVAYVADVKETPEPEVERAERVCDLLGVELRHVEIDRNEFLRLLPEVVYHNDQPNHFPQNVASMAIARAVHRDGFKVLLSGSASDELLGGYGWQAGVHRMWRLRRIHHRLVPAHRLFRRIGRWLARLEPIDLASFESRPFDHLSASADERLKADARAVAVDGLQREVRAAALFRKLEGAGPLEERAFLARSFEDFYTHLRTALESNDKMAMSASVEMRFPFLGNEVIDLSIHLPCEHKYRNRVGKRILKAVGEKHLPRDIVHAPKIGFGTPPRAWQSVMELVDDGYVARVFKWSRRERDEIQHRVRQQDSAAFHLLALELWGRLYHRGETRDELADTLLRLGGEPAGAVAVAAAPVVAT